jgi:hypothetical protein
VAFSDGKVSCMTRRAEKVRGRDPSDGESDSGWRRREGEGGAGDGGGGRADGARQRWGRHRCVRWRISTYGDDGAPQLRLGLGVVGGFLTTGLDEIGGGGCGGLAGVPPRSWVSGRRAEPKWRSYQGWRRGGGGRGRGAADGRTEVVALER